MREPFEGEDQSSCTLLLSSAGVHTPLRLVTQSNLLELPVLAHVKQSTPEFNRSVRVRVAADVGQGDVQLELLQGDTVIR